MNWTMKKLNKKVDYAVWPLTEKVQNNSPLNATENETKSHYKGGIWLS